MTLTPLTAPVVEGASLDELHRVADALAADVDAWQPYVRHDPERRTFTELLSTPRITVWLICWMPGHDTGFHDHDGSAGAARVLQGEIREERLAIGGTPSRIVAAGGAFEFGPHDIHRVLHHGSAPATTLHVYSPPLLRMGQYSVDPDGVLRRQPLDETAELRPDEG